ncbi:MAG: hypothetical protein EOO12_06315 [Chitinophagaceae bacterium]|nr:MAG: hypothetical protein EOO12_06315 [Chitinophagaceae bacterium]
MKIGFTLLILAAGFSSCTPPAPSKSGSGAATTTSAEDVPKQQADYGRSVYSRYVYSAPDGGRLLIQNGLPRGGFRYTNARGAAYSYVVFWTQLTNETDHPLTLELDIPGDAFGIPALPGAYYTVILPADTMTLEQFPRFVNGLKDRESVLNAPAHQAASLRRMVPSKGQSGFYVVLLCPVEGARGAMRTGLRLEGQTLFYRMNVDGSRSNSRSADREIPCGRINLNNLVLQE